MGAYTCEYGIVHKTCRCPTPHTIKCDNAAEHAEQFYAKIREEFKPVVGEHICLVLEMKLDGRIKPGLGKHEAHPPHDWWYTSWGGGHQLDHEPKPGDSDYDLVKKWHCPGRDT